MIEQDLILSRALVELYNNPTVKTSLVFRGGTALNKLYIRPPARYSEDIDLVQIKAEPIGPTIDAIRSVLDSWLGAPKRKLTERSAKLIYRYTAVDQTPAKLKIEINTTEHFHVMPLQQLDFPVKSEWFNGETSIITYQLNELMGTKLRALYQRRKGRDLFDLWYASDKQLIDIDSVITIFEKYCAFQQEPVTRAMFEQSLFFKKQHKDFQSDMASLLAPAVSWHFQPAIELIEKTMISRLKGEPWKVEIFK
jgi:predicted nucleotidyltransferase component of viral defense system